MTTLSTKLARTEEGADMLPGAAPFLSTAQAEGFPARAYDCHIIGRRHLSQGLAIPLSLSAM